MTRPITVIGIGEDGLAGLGATARTALAAAEVIAGGARHLEMLAAADARPRIAWSKDIGADIDVLAAEAGARAVAVLASGDPMWHGIGATLVHRLGADAVRVIPAAGAFSLAAARMGWGLGEPMVACVSVHARPFESLIRAVQPGVRLLILSRDGETPAAVAGLLTEMGYGPSPLTVLERLGGEREARTDTRADARVPGPVDNLNVVAVECVPGPGTRPLSRVPGRPDDSFDHDGTITKRDQRALTLAALAPMPGDVLWDVGAGSGTVAVEWLRAEPRAGAVAFEADAARVARIHANARRLGVPELRVVQGTFPASLADDEAPPDAVFIGGGIAGGAGVVGTCLTHLKPGGRLVANAVTLDAQARLMALAEAEGGDLVRIGIAQAAPVGTRRALRPALDVLQWRYEKP